LDLTVERALNEHRQRVAEVNEGSLCLQSELEKQAAEWNEVLDRTMAGITAQLNSKVNKGVSSFAAIAPNQCITTHPDPSPPR
jgi:hypothetical protein